MDGVGRGTHLAGRYRLTELLDTPGASATSPSGGWSGQLSRYASLSEVWRAEDVTLHRQVAVRVVSGPAGEDVLDAGRRAAIVDDPRFQRIMDVGRTILQDTGDELVYVVCEAVDGTSLRTLLSDGTLAAARVRTIVGETATALASAARAGVHHGALRPGVVLRTADGRVRVTGLALDAVATGSGDEGDEPSEQDDALALVALVYAGLTGLWPLPEVAGAESGLPPAPVVDGVPVAPEELVGGVPNDLDTLCAVTLGPHDDGPRSPAEVVQQLRPWGPLVDDDETASARPTAAPPVPPAPPAAPGPEPTGPTVSQPRVEPAETPVPTAPLERASLEKEQPPVRSAGRFPVRLAAAGAGAAGAGAAAEAGPPGRTAGRTAADRAPDDEHDDPFARLVRGEDGQYLDEDPDDPWAGEEQDDSRSRLALILVAVVVVIGLAFALNTLRGAGGGSDDTAADPSSSAAPSDSAAPSEPAAEEPAAPAETAPVVVGIRTLDPQGDDGTENDDLVTRAIDTDPATTWNSSTYRSADFGGLKDGVGILLTLNGPTQLSGVRVTMNGTGGTVELRAATTESFDGSTVLATGSPVDGVVDLTADAPVETTNVLLWFTQLSTVDGEFRVEVGSVQLR